MKVNSIIFSNTDIVLWSKYLNSILAESTSSSSKPQQEHMIHWWISQLLSSFIVSFVVNYCYSNNHMCQEYDFQFTSISPLLLEWPDPIAVQTEFANRFVSIFEIYSLSKVWPYRALCNSWRFLDKFITCRPWPLP